MKQEKIQYKNTEKFTPEVIGEVLEVQVKYGLTADSLLKKASKKSSSLYEFFDWDNSSAGEKWRLQQARVLINEIKIIVDDKEMYAFENVNVSIIEKESSSREYKSIVEIINNANYRQQLIQRALFEAIYWKNRHSELTELNPIFSLITEISEEWQSKK